MEQESEIYQYRMALVSYIDIFGFKEMIINLEPNEVYDVYQIFRLNFSKNSLTDTEERTGLNFELEIYFFSDSVVRVKYDNGNDNAFTVETDEVISLGLMQTELFQKGILIRGGVARGLIYSNQSANTLFGPALIEAYKLESEFAKVPRIVISDEVYRRYMVDMFSPPYWLKTNGRNNLWTIEQFCNIPEDEGPWFINYFWGPFATYYSWPRTDFKIEEFIANYLALFNKMKIQAENDIYNEHTKLKFLWCKDNQHATIKDIYDWITRGNKSYLVTKNTFQILKEETDIYLSSLRTSKLGILSND